MTLGSLAYYSKKPTLLSKVGSSEYCSLMRDALPGKMSFPGAGCVCCRVSKAVVAANALAALLSDKFLIRISN